MLRLRPVLAASVALVSVLSGCADIFQDLGGAPDYGVQATPLAADGAWNRDNTFRVLAENVSIRIEASQAGRAPVVVEGMNDVTITIPDGTWTVTYWVNGREWKTYDDVRIDTTPPTITGLETVADAAEDGSYVLGRGATVADAVAFAVIDLRTDAVVGRSFPVQLADLPNGLQAFLVSARDEAGNYNNITVQVHVGPAADLPEGKFTFGVVARYTNTVRLWDLSDPEAYLSIPQAQAGAGRAFLGDGFGITPDDSAVRNVVATVVTPDMNSMEAALALYRWFADNLEYDQTRLDSDTPSETLLLPHQVLMDTEDPSGKDCDDPDGGAADCDGLAADGAGNDIRGGICRDLAATYVSMLRAAGIPARLVSGYVAGGVNGFHAWVEFYAGTPAGSGQSPWVPVDVSTIGSSDDATDDAYQPSILLQSFGMELPEYLPLRYVPEAGEVEGWSTALSVRYTWPQGQGQPAPDVRFSKDLTSDFDFEGVLCFNKATRARLVADQENACPRGDNWFVVGDFVRQTERTIDYGITVVSAPKGTRVNAEVAYPFEADIEPDRVVYQFYGEAIDLDPVAGKASADFWPSGR